MTFSLCKHLYKGNNFFYMHHKRRIYNFYLRGIFPNTFDDSRSGLKRSNCSQNIWDQLRATQTLKKNKQNIVRKSITYVFVTKTLRVITKFFNLLRGFSVVSIIVVVRADSVVVCNTFIFTIKKYTLIVFVFHMQSDLIFINFIYLSASITVF